MTRPQSHDDPAGRSAPAAVRGIVSRCRGLRSGCALITMPRKRVVGGADTIARRHRCAERSFGCAASAERLALIRLTHALDDERADALRRLHRPGDFDVESCECVEPPVAFAQRQPTVRDGGDAAPGAIRPLEHFVDKFLRLTGAVTPRRFAVLILETGFAAFQLPDCQVDTLQ